MVSVLLVCYTRMCAAQNHLQDLRKMPSVNGWLHLKYGPKEGGFSIDLPDIFKTSVFADTDYQFWYHRKSRWFFTDTVAWDSTRRFDSPPFVVHVACSATSRAHLGPSYNEEIHFTNYNHLVAAKLTRDYFELLRIPMTFGDSDSDRYVYTRGTNRSGKYRQMEIEFSAKQKPLFDSLITRIAASFH